MNDTNIPAIFHCPTNGSLKLKSIQYEEKRIDLIVALVSCFIDK